MVEIRVFYSYAILHTKIPFHHNIAINHINNELVSPNQTQNQTPAAPLADKLLNHTQYHFKTQL